MKRGVILTMAGVAITGIAYLVLLSLPVFDSVANDGVSSLLGDRSTLEETIPSGESATFQYAPSTSNVLSDADESFMWGVHISNYEPGDSLSVTTTDPLGNVMAVTSVQEREAFMPHVNGYYDLYYFEVTNTGDRQLVVYMTFLNSDDIEEGVIQDVLYLGIVGMIFIVGLVVIAAGVVITLLDWRSSRVRGYYGEA